MYPIYFNNENKGHIFESFEKEFIQICNQHRQENRAMAFAFILYDFENPQVLKILNDTAYWLALNEISGNYLTVFSLNYKPKPKPRQNRSFNPNIVHQLSYITTESNPSYGTNELIRRYFGDVMVRYPAILFFQVNNESIEDQLLVDLREENIENSFLELKEYIKSSVDALKEIAPENRDNIKVIFDNLQSNVGKTKSMRSITRLSRKGGSILNIISIIKGLF